MSNLETIADDLEAQVKALTGMYKDEIKTAYLQNRSAFIGGRLINVVKSIDLQIEALAEFYAENNAEVGE